MKQQGAAIETGSLIPWAGLGEYGKTVSHTVRFNWRTLFHWADRSVRRPRLARGPHRAVANPRSSAGAVSRAVPRRRRAVSIHVTVPGATPLSPRWFAAVPGYAMRVGERAAASEQLLAETLADAEVEATGIDVTAMGLTVRVLRVGTGRRGIAAMSLAVPFEIFGVPRGEGVSEHPRLALCCAPGLSPGHELKRSGVDQLHRVGHAGLTSMTHAVPAARQLADLRATPCRLQGTRWCLGGASTCTPRGAARAPTISRW